jgi:adenylate kinase
VKLRYNCADCGTSYNYKTKPTKLENICDVCGGSSFLCRSDDNEEVLLNRLRMYNAETVVLKEYYEEQGKLYSINGNNKENKITEEIVLILRQKQLA